ncbi:hypothetical protein DPSP01_011815 [Paraphaeosphaeria sporulosa]
MYAVIAAQSKQGSFADFFGPQFWPCAQVPYKAAEQSEWTLTNANTSFQILFVNSAYDPVTLINKA